MVLVIISQSPNQVMLMRWGLIPHWAKEEKTSYKMINARVETLSQRPAFRGLLAANRCLVPASGYYEWKGDGRDKTPYYIHPNAHAYVAFAGLYDVWAKPDGEELYTFTILTKDADEFMAHLHDRMPVILERSWRMIGLIQRSRTRGRSWLSSKQAPASHLTPILCPGWSTSQATIVKH
jgi:putative SOS response-associated peptidase YedK